MALMMTRRTVPVVLLSAGGSSVLLRAALARTPGEGTTVLLRQGIREWLAEGWLNSCVERAGALAPDGHDGTYTSAPLELDPPQERLVLSWQALAPDGTWLDFELRARPAGRFEWSAWVPVGRWGPGTRAASGGRRAAGPAILDVDTLIAADGSLFAEAQYRVRMHGAGADLPRLFSVALLAFTPGVPPLFRVHSPAWGRVLEVPERSQLAEDPALAREICSPTSLAMVLAYFGRDLPVRAVAEAVFDHHARIYGTWPLNTAFASSLGVPMVVDRFERMEQLEEEIISGRPVVISHRWSPGQLRGAPLPASAGHLVVVAGFTTEGDVVVNDPYADPAAGEPVLRTYRREDLHRTWLWQGNGIVYRICGEISSPGL
jgi:uncharacterized protein YvpB